MRRWLALALVWALAPCARAQATPPAELMQQAAEAEREADPALAASRYRQLIEADPTSRLAGRARRRLAWLEARAEGDYRPLAAFLRVRDLRPAERTAAVLAPFETEVRAFPEGTVARESWALLGESWLRLDEPARAEAAFESLLAQPGHTESERVLAHTGIARARAASDGAAAGAEVLERAGLEASATHQALAREAWRGPGRAVAVAILAVFVLAVFALGRRALVEREVLRRAFAPARLAAGAFVALVPWLLASRYDHDAYDTFGLVAAGGAAILALASLGGAAASKRGVARRRRWALAALAALAYGALGWLALDHADQLLSFA